MPLLEMNGIAMRFGAIEALAGVDFTLEAGKITGLMVSTPKRGRERGIVGVVSTSRRVLPFGPVVVHGIGGKPQQRHAVASG